MFTVIVALILLVVGVAAIYLLLKNMGEEGVDVAAPGSCRSRNCKPACAPAGAGQGSDASELGDEDAAASR